MSAFRLLKLLPGVGPNISGKAIDFLAGHKFDIGKLLGFPVPEAGRDLFHKFIKMVWAVHKEDIVWS
ncbi:MAG: DNA helicase-2/ATP-dependent DNA helicase PcrA [Oceanicoccus sp.]|jgi:DNA helicase-2/ATP-dependent DNA helicase PcrA